MPRMTCPKGVALNVFSTIIALISMTLTLTWPPRDAIATATRLSSIIVRPNRNFPELMMLPVCVL